MPRHLTGTRMPVHHYAKCSWGDCAFGLMLSEYKICAGKGMWWHPSCPCWKEIDSDIPNFSKRVKKDLEDYVESQFIKDSMYNLLRWIDQNESNNDYYDDIIDIAYREFEGLIHAMFISEGISRKEIIPQLKENQNLELMFYLLLLKLATISNAFASFITKQ